MFKFLRHPYPIVDASKNMVMMVSIIVFTFVFLFISVFKPFNIEQFATIGVVPAALLFAVFSAGFYLLYVAVTVRLLSGWIRNDRWNIGKELIYINSFLMTLSIGNTGLRNYIAPTVDRSFFENMLDDLFYTYTIALFPVATIITIRYIKELKSKSVNAVLKDVVDYPIIKIKSQAGNNDVSCQTDELLFLRSEGNYVEIYLRQSDKVERIVQRNTLGNILDQVDEYQEFFRSHRRYIVNTRKIVEVKGNAQGYRLRLDGVEDIIPVSRNNVDDFNRKYQ